MAKTEKQKLILEIRAVEQQLRRHNHNKKYLMGHEVYKFKQRQYYKLTADQQIKKSISWNKKHQDQKNKNNSKYYHKNKDKINAEKRKEAAFRNFIFRIEKPLRDQERARKHKLESLRIYRARSLSAWRQFWSGV